MLDNTLTLAYDAEGDGNPVDVVLRRIAEYPDRSVYAFPDNDGTSHTLTLYRTVAKKSGNFLGVDRVREKIVKPVTVLGADGSNVQSAIIHEQSTSYPRGMTEAEKIASLQEMIATNSNVPLRTYHYVKGEV